MQESICSKQVGLNFFKMSEFWQKDVLSSLRHIETGVSILVNISDNDTKILECE